jgi:hypothetical protein
LGASPPPGCDEPTSRWKSTLSCGLDYIIFLPPRLGNRCYHALVLIKAGVGVLAFAQAHFEPTKTLSFRISRYGVIRSTQNTRLLGVGTRWKFAHFQSTYPFSNQFKVACVLTEDFPRYRRAKALEACKASSHSFADGFTVISRFVGTGLLLQHPDLLRCQTAPPLWTLGSDKPVIPRVPFI